MKSKKNSISESYIKIRGARVHNLKSVDLDLPKNNLIVITGLSGSGKSSLAFDTIYAEAERRYVESLSSYARQFLGVQDKPDVEAIDGLSPAISIDQKSVSKNPRSTVGTITEIYDYLRILFARVGKPHCHKCGKPVRRQTIEEMLKVIKKIKAATEIAVFAPLIRGKKGEHKNVLVEIKQAGFLRVRLDDAIITLEEAIEKVSAFSKNEKNKKHSIDVLVDRFRLEKDIETSRIRDSLETALKIGKGAVVISETEKTGSPRTTQEAPPGRAERNTSVVSQSEVPRGHAWEGVVRGSQDTLFSEHFACSDCGTNLPEIEPRTFSFNSPYGACPTCTGLGSTLEVDIDLVLPNKRLSISEGAIRPWAGASHRLGRQSWYWWMLDDIASRYKFSLNTSVEKLPKNIIDIILYGEETKNIHTTGENSVFEGVIQNLKRRWKDTDSDFTRSEIEKYMIIKVCPECHGMRLRKEALAVKIGEENIASLVTRTADNLEIFFRSFIGSSSRVFSQNEIKIASPLIKEIIQRLTFLNDVGVGYLSLARESTTLAGGEAQRIRLATQIGSRLTGIIYILDEPSIGLHPRDHARLIQTLKDLRNLGNTVLVVEHDAETMRAADWIVELGPGAGKHGGKVVFSGTPNSLYKARTLTGEYLSGRKKVCVSKETAAKKTGGFLTIEGASEHNLKNITVKIPLGKFVAVSGVSGSGKSTLANDILARALSAKLYGAHVFPGAHKKITGIEYINKAVVVDQSPIGRTPRSNPATYTGAFGFIRTIFARMPEARARGYAPGRFSFNVKGGRCEACEGQGVKKIEMYFLPDVYVECEECKGKRYNREALEIEYQGKNIAEVLELPIEEAMRFFEAIPTIKAKLETMYDVGLGYLKLGQPAPTLSGGEAQRVKLATELSRRDTGKTLYILDEPTTGLHFDDIQKLLKILRAIVKKGNTVLVIEHNLDVLKNSDWVIDLGPEGGEHGGRIIAEGTPEDLMRIKNCYTGVWLKASR